MYAYVNTCVYLSLGRPSEPFLPRSSERNQGLRRLRRLRRLFRYIYIYVYIHIYVFTHTHIYIYINDLSLRRPAKPFLPRASKRSHRLRRLFRLFPCRRARASSHREISARRLPRPFRRRDFRWNTVQRRTAASDNADLIYSGGGGGEGDHQQRRQQGRVLRSVDRELSRE